MTVLKVVDNYQICSKKIDNCPPAWGAWTSCFGVGLMLLWLFMILPFCIVYKYTSLDMWIPVNIIILLVSAAGICLPMLTIFIKCGVRIEVRSYSYFGMTTPIFFKEYQLTDDKEKDAVGIQEIVDVYEKKIYEILEKEQMEFKEKEKKKLDCCDKYKSVIELVKK